jgi:beta-mannosidase
MRVLSWVALVGLASLVDLVGCAPAPSSLANATRAGAPAEAQVDLGGDWRYLPYDGQGNMAAAEINDAAWPTMRLPSSWFLMGRKQYPPKATAMPAPFGDNAPGALWPVDPDMGLDYSGTVWFRRSIDWQPSASPSPVVLDLDMVDYYAEVFVNGASVGRHEGYFQHWSVDVTKALRSGRNLLAIKVSAPALAFDMSQQYAVSWPKMQNQVKGIFAYHDTRPGATSPRGQERSTGGVLRGVTLRRSPGVDLAEVVVLPRDVSAKLARLVVEATLENWTGAPADVTLDGVVKPSNFDGPAAGSVHLATTAPPGRSRVRTELAVPSPHLWWSWDYGKPNLYAIDARLTQPGGESDRSARFGIRSIERDEKWVFTLNGQRIYPRGTNYIATQWLSQADREFYARDLRLALGANLNSIRVHAHLERPEFYDLADEMGIMVWQDFPLQWGYTDLPSFHAEALRQAEDMVVQYGDHPSIVVWSMHNESPYAMTWMKRRDPDQNRALDEALTTLVRGLDPSRVVHRDSGTGDGHYYYGWYDGQLNDVARAEEAPFVTEYGAEALPSAETLKTMFDAKTLWPRTAQDWETWKFADFQPKTTFDIAGVQQGEDLVAFIRNSQRYQATVVRYTTELLRRRKWAGNTGVYQFMFVDDWPSITWSVLDYYRRPKLGYDAMKSAMQRVLPSIAYDPQNPAAPISIYVVNDLLAPLTRAKVAWRVTGIADATPREQVVDVPADGVIKVADLGPMRALAEGARLDVRVTSAAGEAIAESHLGAEDFVERRPSEGRSASQGE